MLPKPCWSLSSAFVSSLRFQLLKTSGKLQLLNWSDTELPTFLRSSRFPCYRNRWISWHAPTTAAHCFSQVAKFKDLSFEVPRFWTVERWEQLGSAWPFPSLAPCFSAGKSGRRRSPTAGQEPQLRAGPVGSQDRTPGLKNDQLLQLPSDIDFKTLKHGFQCK